VNLMRTYKLYLKCATNNSIQSLYILPMHGCKPLNADPSLNFVEQALPMRSGESTFHIGLVGIHRLVFLSRTRTM